MNVLENEVMVIPAGGTFEYAAVIPDFQAAEFSCPMQLLQADKELDRLVGWNPTLHVRDAGSTPNPSPRNPATQRSQVRIVASEKQHATMAEVAFILDRGVISALRAEDRLFMARTGCGRIGVSAMRDGQLIFAVGAITSVPLGCDFVACIPDQLVREAENIFRTHDAHFNLRENPLEFRVGPERRIFFQARVKMGDFEIYMLHGHYNGIPGTDACVSVARIGACPVIDANTSALFLDNEHLAMTRW